jgi:hypothetical protein
MHNIAALDIQQNECGLVESLGRMIGVHDQSVTYQHREVVLILPSDGLYVQLIAERYRRVNSLQISLRETSFCLFGWGCLCTGWR